MAGACQTTLRRFARPLLSSMISEGSRREGQARDVIEGHRDEVCTNTQESGLYLCGLQSAATSHSSVGECVDALQRELARLRNHLH